MPCAAFPVTVGSCQLGSSLLTTDIFTLEILLAPVALSEAADILRTTLINLKPFVGIVCSVPVASCTLLCNVVASGLMFAISL